MMLPKFWARFALIVLYNIEKVKKKSIFFSLLMIHSEMTLLCEKICV